MVQSSSDVPTRLQVFDILDRLEASTAAATKLPLTRRAVINPAEVQELVNKLRHVLPNEITEAQQILRYRESMLSKAQAEAKHLRESAEQVSLQKISETQVMRDARKAAEELKESAEKKAEEIIARGEAAAQARIEGADAYASDVLRKLEEELNTLIATTRRGLEVLRTGRRLDGPQERPQR